VVWFDALDDQHDAEIIEAFGEARHRLQRAIATQSTAKHTPVLEFRPDDAIRTGERIERLLKDQPERPPEPEGANDVYRTPVRHDDELGDEGDEDEDEDEYDEDDEDDEDDGQA
jgi:hypothetical protein